MARLKVVDRNSITLALVNICSDRTRETYYILFSGSNSQLKKKKGRVARQNWWFRKNINIYVQLRHNHHQWMHSEFKKKSSTEMLSMTSLMRIQTPIVVDKNQNKHQQKKIPVIRRPAIQTHHTWELAGRAVVERERSAAIAQTERKWCNERPTTAGTTTMASQGANASVLNGYNSNMVRSRDEGIQVRMRQSMCCQLFYV